MERARVPAIVMCGGAAGLAVVRSLGAKGVPVVAVSADPKEFAPLSAFAAERWYAPHPEASQKEFLGLLLDRASLWQGSLLVPCSDAFLTAVSRAKDVLEQYYRVACPSWDVTSHFLEKKNTRQLAVAASVPCPWTYLVRSDQELEQYRSAITFPCLVKPSSSHLYHERFHTKMRCVESFEQARRAVSEAAEHGLEMMLQEFIPGEDANGANYNAYFWEGVPLVEFTARKLRNAPPQFGSPRVVVSERIPEVLEPGRRLLRATRFSGFACTEFKRDPRDGTYKLLEVNARHNLSGQLAVRCGIDFPYLQYQHLVEGRVPTARAFETGVYWIELLRDLAQSARHRRFERYAASEYLRPYLGRHIYAVGSWRDPKPFLMQGLGAALRALRRVAPPPN